MPDPIDALRRATGIGPDPLTEHVVQQAMPLGFPMAPLPAPVKALINVLRKGPGTTDPLKFLQMERIGGRIPASPQLRVPEGFTLPKGFNPTPSPRTFRDASLQQEGYLGGFGRSPEMAYQRHLQDPFYRPKPSFNQRLAHENPYTVRSVDELAALNPRMVW